MYIQYIPNHTFVTRYSITDACIRLFTALRQHEFRSILQHTEKSYQQAVNISDIM